MWKLPLTIAVIFTVLVATGIAVSANEDLQPGARRVDSLHELKSIPRGNDPNDLDSNPDTVFPWLLFYPAFIKVKVPSCTDADSDGYFAEKGCGTPVDCNDKDSSIYPGAPELCDGKDNQCPGDAGYGQVDEGCGNGDYLLPDTGQDRCYDHTQEITCPNPGEPFYGQDAQYHGPQPAYQDNGDGTVTDLNTGLMWQQDDDGIERMWQPAMNNCEDLRLAGHTDWRLPTRRELVSVVDYGRWLPAINTDYFPTCRLDEYWSSSPYVDYPDDAWLVDFVSGNAAHRKRSYYHYVRCVRGESSLSEFVANGNGTVSDALTGLMWQQTDDGQERNWEEALDYCESLGLAGYRDWRLPNIRELESIVDDARHDPAIDPVFECRSFFYRSGSTEVIGPVSSWYVYFFNGRVNVSFKTSNYSVRCVRGGL